MQRTHRLHLYTGSGKGKTTVAMGLALRALGHGWQVVVAQWLKDGTSGELTPLRRLGARVMAAPPFPFTWQMDEAQLTQCKAEQTAFCEAVAAALPAGGPALIVLDELAEAAALGLVPEKAALTLAESCLAAGETVLTGAEAPRLLQDRADYWTQLTAERHPYETEGLAAREGVEF